MDNYAVVFVDDEINVVDTLRRQLHIKPREELASELHIDLKFEYVENAEEGLEVIDELEKSGHRVAVVVTDQIMPKMNGDEFLIYLHSQKKHRSIVKILLTGQADADAVGNALNNANLYNYISKPWEQVDLRIRIRQALRRFQMNTLLEEMEEVIDPRQRHIIDNYEENSLLNIDESILFCSFVFKRFLGSVDPAVLEWVTDATIGIICSKKRKLTPREWGYVSTLVKLHNSNEKATKIVDKLKTRNTPKLNHLKLIDRKLAHNIFDQLINLTTNNGTVAKRSQKYLEFLGGRLGFDKSTVDRLLGSELEKQKAAEAAKNMVPIYSSVGQSSFFNEE